MTTIIYAKDTLAADSRSLHDYGEAGTSNYFTAIEMLKLMVLGEGTFAVAVCGPVPTIRGWKDIEEIFRKRLIICEEILNASRIEFLPEEIKAIAGQDRYFLVMTKAHTYFMSPIVGLNSDGINGLMQIDSISPIAYGTGAKPAYMAIVAGRSTHEAVEFAITIDNNSGSPVVSVDRKSLKAFGESDPELGKLLIKFKKKHADKI